MSTRFEDSASAYRLHRRVTNEAEAIGAAVGRYAGGELGLTRARLRVLDAGTGDGQVLKGVVGELLQDYRHRSCQMVLKEYDFQHIETLLQNVAPLLRRSPHLTLFITNRAFRKLKDFPEDLSLENTVCFDAVAGYRLAAMTGTAALLSQHDGPRFVPVKLDRAAPRDHSEAMFMPNHGLWSGERALLSQESAVVAPALAALGDEIRAREIYDELAATGATGKHFTVTVARRNGESDVGFIGEFYWDLAIVSHAFNRDKDVGWICRNILHPLCEGLALGGVLANVHAIDGGHVSELRRELFADQFAFNAPPAALAESLASSLDPEEFEFLPETTIPYRSHLTADALTSLEPWQRRLALEELAVSFAYHLQIPDAAWRHLSAIIETRIEQILQRDGRLEYALSIAGVKRRA